MENGKWKMENGYDLTFSVALVEAMLPCFDEAVRKSSSKLKSNQDHLIIILAIFYRTKTCY